MIRNAVEGILAEKAAEKFATTAAVRAPDAVDALGGGTGFGAIQTGTFPTPTGIPGLSSGALPQHILLRWPWVDTETITLIQLGKFDIEALPKLHQTDELRNAHVKRSVKGILQPLDGGPSEILIGTTKLQSSFKDPTTFFLAWQIYVSIRMTFHPNRASGLAFWTERLQFYIYLNYPWTGILEYIIAFYKLNQDASPDSWFEPNPTLISYYLTLHQQKPGTVTPQAATGGLKTGGGSKSKSANSRAKSSNEMCVMFNRVVGCSWPQSHGGQKCPHRHTCNVCTSDQHNAVSCPKLSTK